MGPQHVVKGDLKGNRVLKNNPQSKYGMTPEKYPSEVHTPLQVHDEIPGIDPCLTKSSGVDKWVGQRSPQLGGQDITSKPYRNSNDTRNSGLPKAGNGYGNGGFIVMKRYYGTKFNNIRSEGNQSDRMISNQTDICPSENTNHKDIDRSRISPWVGRYNAFFEKDLYLIAYT